MFSYCMVLIHSYLFFYWALILSTLVVIESNVPVVYVLFGTAQPYFMINLELALRNNRVILITDTDHHIEDKRLCVVNIKSYSSGAAQFNKQFKHLSKDQKWSRRQYEVQCFMRWFVLRDYMKAKGLEKAFFGDGDTAVFSNMAKAFDQRSNCTAVINVEMQAHRHHWVGAGESSLWTLNGITAFCNFVTSLYTTHLVTLTDKVRNDGSTVTDMSALWLWWVATHRTATGWNTGRPYQPMHCDKVGVLPDCNTTHALFDEAFEYAKKLRLPTVDGNLKVCNGLDVVSRNVFDHQHGWRSGEYFSLNLNGSGVPSFMGAATGIAGGAAETLDPTELKRLQHEPIEMLTLHYQGNAKHMLAYDVCRVLLLTGSRLIKSSTVVGLCESESKNAANKWPECKVHSDEDGSAVCI